MKYNLWYIYEFGEISPSYSIKKSSNHSFIFLSLFDIATIKKLYLKSDQLIWIERLY
ncbi:hypothetical protein D3C85_1170350 [compost metagenome]